MGPSEPPTVRIEPRYLQVETGDSIEFRCIASGLPQPSLEWTRDGGELNPQSTFQVSCSGVKFFFVPKHVV